MTQSLVQNLDLIRGKIFVEVKIQYLKCLLVSLVFSPFDKLIIEKGGNPIRSIVLSTWRSGSTFVGDILNAHPANFYHYEPLLHYGIIQIRDPPLTDEAVQDLESMFKCDYSNLGA